jgi:hypothetical protein
LSVSPRRGRTIFQMSSVPIALADPLDADSRSESRWSEFG